MNYPTLDITHAREALTLLREDAAPRVPDAVWRTRGTPEAFDIDLPHEVARDLLKLLSDLRQDGGVRALGQRFEGQAAGLLHSRLNLPVYVAADLDFWRWFVFGSGSELPYAVIVQRHSNEKTQPSNIAEANFGITTQIEYGLFSRLWLRAQLAYDPSSDDPYALAKIGSQDLWRSHIFRTEYGMIPHIARAFIRYTEEEIGSGQGGTDVVRAMAKELRRRQASSAFELLSDEDAIELMRECHREVNREAL